MWSILVSIDVLLEVYLPQPIPHFSLLQYCGSDASTKAAAAVKVVMRGRTWPLDFSLLAPFAENPACTTTSRTAITELIELVLLLMECSPYRSNHSHFKLLNATTLQHRSSFIIMISEIVTSWKYICVYTSKDFKSPECRQGCNSTSRRGGELSRFDAI